MTANRNTRLHIGQQNVVQEFRYLRSQITTGGKSLKDIKQRIAQEKITSCYAKEQKRISRNIDTCRVLIYTDVNLGWQEQQKRKLQIILKCVESK